MENLAERYSKVKELHSLWLLLRKRIEEELTNGSSIFVNYSLHDGSHSRSIIQAVERFLGEKRICQLPATDTFMLFACVYSHDYGMSSGKFAYLSTILDTYTNTSFIQVVNDKELRQSMSRKGNCWVNALQESYER